MPSSRYSALIDLIGEEEAEAAAMKALLDSLPVVMPIYRAGYINEIEFKLLRGNINGTHWYRRFRAYFLLTRNTNKPSKDSIRWFSTREEALGMRMLRGLAA